MTIRLLKLAMLLALTSQAQYWQQMPDFPGFARDDAASFTLQNKHYVGTGVTNWFAPTRDFHAFNINTQTWDSVAALPVGQERQYATGFATQTHGYIFGGYNGTNFLNDLWQYNPTTNAWLQMASMPALGRSGAVCMNVNTDTIFIMGGQTDSSAAINEVWAYSLNHNTWTQKPDLPFSSWRGSSACHINQCYALFGKDNNNVYNDSLYFFSHFANYQFYSLAKAPFGGRIYAGMAIPRDVYIVGGMDSTGTFYNDLWRYDYGQDTWHQEDSLPGMPRRGGAVLGNYYHSLFYSTGLLTNGQRTKETWLYNIPIGIEENGLQNQISIYPNPVQDVLNLALPTHVNSTGFTWRILNVNGAAMRHAQILEPSIFVGDLPRGVYTLQLETTNKVIYKRFVKL